MTEHLVFFGAFKGHKKCSPPNSQVYFEEGTLRVKCLGEKFHPSVHEVELVTPSNEEFPTNPLTWLYVVRSLGIFLHQDSCLKLYNLRSDLYMLRCLPLNPGFVLKKGQGEKVAKDLDKQFVIYQFCLSDSSTDPSGPVEVVPGGNTVIPEKNSPKGVSEILKPPEVP